MNYLDILVPCMQNAELTDATIVSIVRTYRNQQLAASDWTQLPDIDTDKVNVAAWRVYRQELRDMMDQSDDPKEIVFPTPPE